MRHAAALLALLAPAGAAPAADAPPLVLPVACEPGRDCHVQNHVDVDPGPGAADFRCGQLTYDGHDGTDFALPTLAAMTRGVAVRAAAGGVVAAVRDGMPDAALPVAPRMLAAAVAGRECGNGVLLDHGGGWTTQYCHLAEGSLAVAVGDAVAPGERLGDVGMSGLTEFPHLHFVVRQDGEAVDPFDAQGTPACDDADPLWAEPLPYRGTGAIGAGLLGRVPTWDEVRAAPPPTGAGTGRAEPLVAWIHAFGGRRGDVVRFRIEGPGGAVVHTDEAALGEDQAAFFRASGRQAPEGGWPPGRYAARVEVARDGAVVAGARAEARL